MSRVRSGRRAVRSHHALGGGPGVRTARPGRVLGSRRWRSAAGMRVVVATSFAYRARNLCGVNCSRRLVSRLRGTKAESHLRSGSGTCGSDGTSGRSPAAPRRRRAGLGARGTRAPASGRCRRGGAGGKRGCERPTSGFYPASEREEGRRESAFPLVSGAPETIPLGSIVMHSGMSPRFRNTNLSGQPPRCPCGVFRREAG